MYFGWVRIVDVNEFYAEQGGGVRTYVNAKLQAAAEHGHQLTILAPGPKNARQARLGGEVIWLESPPMPFDPRYYVLHRESAVHEWLAKLDPHIVEGSSPWTSGWFAARYRKPVKRVFIYHQDPVAVYAHTFFDRRLSVETLDSLCAPYWAYTRRLANHFDATVVAGQWLAQRLAARGVTNAVAVPFGIDRSAFSAGLANEDLRAAWLAKCGLGASAKLLVAISRHHPEKRVGTLIEAVRQLNAGDAPVGLVVFGDGPLRRRIEGLVRGVPQVHLAGFVADRPMIARVLASADGFVHGSAAETYGFVVAEALCSGTPAVVPNRGGASDLVTPECAEVYTPGDPGACADAIRRLLQRDRQTLATACLAHASARVGSQTQHFSALFSLYETLLGRPTQA